MGAALLLYAGVSIFFYVVNGPPPPDGYTHDDVCVRCGEDYEWISPFDSAVGNESFNAGNPQQMIIVEEK
jgi:hypothetical protein